MRVTSSGPGKLEQTAETLKPTGVELLLQAASRHDATTALQFAALGRLRRITPQLSGGALRCPARRMCTMKCRTCGAHATTYDRPLQLLVRRLAQHWRQSLEAH